jgi:hypothetical protein
MDRSLKESITQCSKTIQHQWLVSQPLELSEPQLDNLIMGYEQKNGGYEIDISTKIFFHYLWKEQKSFVGDCAPKILVIAINPQHDTYESANFLTAWSNSMDESTPKLVFPLWDIEEQIYLNPTELRGKLSQSYSELLKKYHANILFIIQGDILSDRFDARIVCPTKKINLEFYTESLAVLKKNLINFITTYYALTQKITTATLQANRPYWNMISLTQALKKHVEIESIIPQSITAQSLTINIQGYWNKEQWTIFLEDYSSLKLIDHH